jgi:hypothetical protein
MQLTSSQQSGIESANPKVKVMLRLTVSQSVCFGKVKVKRITLTNAYWSLGRN